MGRIQVSQDEISIGDRGRVASEPVAGRSGHGTRALGTDLDQAQTIDTGNASPTCTDLEQVQHRDIDRKAGTLFAAIHTRRLVFVRDGRPAV